VRALDYKGSPPERTVRYGRGFPPGALDLTFNTKDAIIKEERLDV